MKIGFFSKWNIQKGKFVGDHLYAGYLCKNLVKIEGVDSAELFAPNKMPSEKLDFMIYLNDTIMIERLAKKHILYLQNGYTKEETIKKLKQLRGFDLYLFVSEKSKEISEKMGYNSEMLTFGVETSVFYPRNFNNKYSFDVTYVGNDIKGPEITKKFILPAKLFNFGLFGDWNFSKKVLFRYLYFFVPKYKKILKKISRGKISSENISILYSSSKVNLNCTNQGFVEMDSFTARPLEILACKGFLITDDIPYLRKIIGDGAVYSTGGRDLIEKIKYYLKHEDERKKIAEKGYNRVIKNETVEVKAGQLLKYLREFI